MRVKKFFACESFQDLPKELILKSLFDTPEEILQKAVCHRDVVYPASREDEYLDLCRLSRQRLAIVIGDRASDKKGAVTNGLPFIGCAYGYGTAEELEGADAVAKEVPELRDLIMKTAGLSVNLP